MPNSKHCILFSTLPRGTLVHCNHGCVFILTKDKVWSDKTVSATLIHGSKADLGAHNEHWCADVLYTHEYFE